jgi:hypothetical protein
MLKYSKSIRMTLLIGSVAICAGCAHAPEVDYALYDLNAAGASSPTAKLIAGSEPGTGAIKFTPTGSYILIADAPPAPAPGTTKQPKAGDPTGAAERALDVVTQALESPAASTSVTSAADLKKKSFTVTAGSSTQYLIAITPREHFYFKPNIAATFASGTSRLTDLGADSQDTTTSTITTAFGIVTSLIGLVAAEDVPKPTPPLLALPYVLDLTPAVVDKCIYKDTPDASVTWCVFDTTLTSWKYRLKLVSGRTGRPLYGDSGTQGFFIKDTTKTSSREFPFSPCIQVVLQIQGPVGKPEDIKPALTIADPSWVETYLIPAKGSITVNGVCGANIKPQNYTAPTPLDVVKAITDGLGLLKSKQAPASTATATTAKK